MRKPDFYLKRCPFCGQTPEIVHTTPFWVACKKYECGAQGPYRKTPAAAARVWNNIKFYLGNLRPVYKDENGDFGPRWERTLP